MAPPATREAARLAASRVARQAASVFRAVTQGPPLPAPGGQGVDVGELRQVLPWLQWRELAVFANHFGQRKRVVGDVAAEVAAEIGKRLKTEAHAEPIPHSDSAAADALLAASPREVAAVVYAYSKLDPQLPEYSAVFDAAAVGILRRAWTLSRLQAVLIGTAFADTQQRLSDALPAVLGPVLRELVEDPDAAPTADELRYLLHACTRLPEPGPASDEVQALWLCTRRVLPTLSFQRTSHLAVSWLCIRPPPLAKEHHLAALDAVWSHLEAQKWQGLAHPLPVEGLAPAFIALLEREKQPTPPPLTPPQLKNIVMGLMHMSRSEHPEAVARNKGLGLTDWVGIAGAVVDFCESHGNLEEPGAGRRSLPRFAAQMLGHMVVRARRDADGAPADLDALLALLRLVVRYRPLPDPDAAFFTWAARQLAAHGGAPSSRLAEAVSVLVPRLPEAERSLLAQALRPRPTAAVAARGAQLLACGPRPSVAVALEGAERAPATRASRPHSPRSRVWGLLSPAAPEAIEQAVAQVVVSERPSVQPVMHAETTPSKAEAAEELHTLRARLEQALARVEALESKLDDQAQQGVVERQAWRRMEDLETRLEDHERQIREARVAKNHDDMFTPQADGKKLSGLGDELGAWPSASIGGGLGGAMVAAVQPSQSMARFHRPFNFEEFRRANSAQLQLERFRVIAPPDHIPVWPLMPKK